MLTDRNQNLSWITACLKKYFKIDSEYEYMKIFSR